MTPIGWRRAAGAACLAQAAAMRRSGLYSMARLCLTYARTMREHPYPCIVATTLSVWPWRCETGRCDVLDYAGAWTRDALAYA